MNGKTSFDITIAEELLTGFGQALGQIQGLQGRLRTEQSTLVGSWDGQARAQFEEAYEGMDGQLKMLSDRLGELRSWLQRETEQVKETFSA